MIAVTSDVSCSPTHVWCLIIVCQEDSETQKALLERVCMACCQTSMLLAVWALLQDPMPLKDTWVLWEQARGLGRVQGGDSVECGFG